MEDNKKFPDSFFSASASTQDHGASDARITSRSSWCAPVSEEKHYLQVDFGRLYLLYYLVTYGDARSQQWVATFDIKYTMDSIKWQNAATVKNITNYTINHIV